MFYLAFCPFVAQGMSQLSAFYYIEHHILHLFRISLRMVRHCTHGYSSPGTHTEGMSQCNPILLHFHLGNSIPKNYNKAMTHE